MAKLAYTGGFTNASFPIAGRRLLVAPTNTALPGTIEPISDTNMPSGWTDLGPTENSEVTINLSRTTEDINTGVIPTARRTYLTGQDGSMEATLQLYEPTFIGYAGGVDPVAYVPAAGGDRGYQDIFLGGTLGDILSVICFEDFDIDLVEDAAGGHTFEQVLHYSPTVQGDGDVNLSARVTKAPAVAIRFKLLGFEDAGAPGRTVLLQQRWIAAA